MGFRENAHSKVVVREDLVEGKGLCYIYSDNTHCPKSVNGDIVNPKWGTTKAGKPRKRLGQACNTCREKKIRCDPQIPKCAQCQKFGRECKFEPGVRGSQRSTRGSSPGDAPSLQERRNSIFHDRHGSETSAGQTSATRSSINVDHLLSPASTHSLGSHESPPGKRRKFSTSPNIDSRPVATPRPVPNDRTFSPNVDPFSCDPQMTMHYIGSFLTNFNGNLYQIFPTDKFVAWLQNAAAKSSSDMLLMYTMMAFGTIFAAAPSVEERQHDRDVFLRIVDEAMNRQSSRPSLQMVQSLVLLSLLRFSRGQLEESRELCTSAMRLGTDIGLSRERIESVEPYFGLDAHTSDECRRRTFWVAYIVDTLLQYYVAWQGRPISVDCKLQVPCSQTQYDDGSIPQLPVAEFHGLDPHDIPLDNGSSVLTKLVGGIAILRDIVSWVKCLKDMDVSQIQASQQDFQDQINWRLAAWKQKVTGMTQAEEDRKLAEGKKVDPDELLIVYHLGKMVLHRHVRHEFMTRQQVEMNCREVRSHAYALLQLLHTLHERSNFDERTPLTACPVAGYAAFVAVDIITAAGSMSSVLESSAEDIYDGLHHERMDTGAHDTFMDLVPTASEALVNLGQYWDTARRQGELVTSRFQTVLMAAKTGSSSQKAAYFIRNSFCSPFGMDMDVIYGITKLALFKALGMGDRVRNQFDLYEIQG
ncbi:uncharacterized protein HMPREF1541_01880 [Cyphellophora europaea CBS 101466]|uniref:Zn(2)-C6 fungal-type domain-containing protein n=1 Tax=Cyphellophora europaea (strain CBS 101466) TaxID=1220924 RepID=W2S212_CYPE1|nr:uncharacterized protein HMPREF1541_01880 [Cyphellophora europaea CBS 101466]ETN42722.1 hypothetical protein HMPREF1541_01880 [Cyphellophora europaea CBS 101466]